jgi:hypothetical protein
MKAHILGYFFFIIILALSHTHTTYAQQIPSIDQDISSGNNTLEILLNTSLQGEQILLTTRPPPAEQYPHRDYDWEGDGDLPFTPSLETNKSPPQQAESCYACHYGGMFPRKGFIRKRCEDCHVVNTSTGNPNGPYLVYDLRGGDQFILRKDYDISPLIVSEHLGIRGQRKNNYSSCLDFDLETGEGTCHGISITNNKNAGGYFAFNVSPAGQFPPLSSEYLPDTGNCLFCHHQNDSTLRIAWGEPQQIDTPDQIKIHLNVTTNDDCYKCHVEGSNKPKNFHSASIYIERIEKVTDGEAEIENKTFGEAEIENKTDGEAEIENKTDAEAENFISRFVKLLIEYLRGLISRWT